MNEMKLSDKDKVNKGRKFLVLQCEGKFFKIKICIKFDTFQKFALTLLLVSPSIVYKVYISIFLIICRSWLEIGSSISHFCGVNAFIIFHMLLFLFSNFILRKVEFHTSINDDDSHNSEFFHSKNSSKQNHI
jgi:hypothetical protein